MALIQSMLILNIFIVQSGSMEPSIKTGSVVFSVKSNDYKSGDVISFYSDPTKKTVVTHRIVAESNNKFLTSGDANKTIDEAKIPENQIIGKVFLTVPYLGYFFNWAKTPKGLILLVLIPATIIIYEELKFIFGEIKKKINLNPKFKKSYFLIPIIPIIGSFVFISNYSGAFFTDSKTSANNIFATATSPPSPSPAPICESQWASSVISHSQGLTKSGSVVALDRSDPSKALGPAESSGQTSDNPVIPNTFYSLGFGGQIVLKFLNPFANQIGNDLQIYEITGGVYPDEKVNVDVSEDGTTWTNVANSVARDAQINIDPLESARYIRLTDVSDKNLFELSADGYDLDAVKTLCSERQSQ